MGYNKLNCIKRRYKKMDQDKEIAKYEQEAEKAKAAYLQCLGIVQYLKQQKEEAGSKKEGK